MLLRQVLQYASARVVPAVSAFAALAVFTRVLQPDAYGLYLVLVATATLIHSAGLRWLDLSLLRLWPSWTEKRASGLRTLFSLFWVALLPASFAAIVAALYATPVAIEPLALIALAGYFVAFSLVEIQLAVAIAESRVANYAAALAVRALAFLCIGWWLAGSQTGAAALLIANLVGQAAAAVFLFWRRPVPVFAGVKVERDDTREILAFGIPLSFSFMLTAIVGASDRILLARLTSLTDAGLYAAPYDLGTQVVFLSGIIVNLAAYPLLMKSVERSGFRGSMDNLRQHLAFLLAVLLLVSWPFVASPQIVTHWVLGAEYRLSAERLLPIIAAIGIVAALKSFYFDLAFHIAKRTGLLVALNAVTAALNILLNLAFIPEWGILGAAVATLLSYVAGLMLSIGLGAWIRTSLPIPVRQVVSFGGAVCIGAAAHHLLSAVEVGARDYLAFAGGMAGLLLGYWITGLGRHLLRKPS